MFQLLTLFPGVGETSDLESSVQAGTCGKPPGLPPMPPGPPPGGPEPPFGGPKPPPPPLPDGGPPPGGGGGNGRLPPGGGCPQGGCGGLPQGRLPGRRCGSAAPSFMYRARTNTGKADRSIFFIEEPVSSNSISTFLLQSKSVTVDPSGPLSCLL